MEESDELSEIVIPTPSDHVEYSVGVGWHLPRSSLQS